MRQTTIHAHIHTYGQLSPINLSMSLDCERKPKNPKGTHADTGSGLIPRASNNNTGPSESGMKAQTQASVWDTPGFQVIPILKKHLCQSMLRSTAPEVRWSSMHSDKVHIVGMVRCVKQTQDSYSGGHCSCPVLKSKDQKVLRSRTEGTEQTERKLWSFTKPKVYFLAFSDVKQYPVRYMVNPRGPHQESICDELGKSWGANTWDNMLWWDWVLTEASSDGVLMESQGNWHYPWKPS